MDARDFRILAALTGVALAACGGSDTSSADGQQNGSVSMPAGTMGTGGTGSGGTGSLTGSGAGSGGIGGSGGNVATMPTTPTGSGGMVGATAGMGGTVLDAGTMMPAVDAGMGTHPDGGGDISMCPKPPADAAPEAVAALNAVNMLRLAVGSGCDSMASALNTSSQSHCEYYAANASMMTCIADPHTEVSTCMSFYAASFGDRAKKAGYMGASSEVMAFNNDAQASVTQWVGSVWHRLPILDPWTTEMGYGHAAMCDTIDFGRGTMPAPDNTLVVYPYNGQTGVETEFNGMYEGPMPPAPPAGWPSAVPITVYGKNMMITDHVLTLDGDTKPIDHTWLTAGDSQFLRNAVMMYGNVALTAQTKYHVRIKGSYVGGALDLEWTFTTGDAPKHWGGP